MDNSILDIYLRELKFIVLVDASTDEPFAIHFGFTLPNMHSEIFLDAVETYKDNYSDISVLGGGRITKVGNKIIFYAESERYGRYDDKSVLELAPLHEIFKGKKFEFYSKAGERDFNKIIGCVTNADSSKNQ